METTPVDKRLLNSTHEKSGLTLLTSRPPEVQGADNLDVFKELIRRKASGGSIDNNGMKVDGRRLYDDAFKAEALRQLSAGENVRSISKALGVSVVTLHKWRKQELAGLLSPIKCDLNKSEAVNANGIEAALLQIKQLQNQLRLAEQERDILKKAICILVRPS